MPSSIRFSPPSPLALVLLGGLVWGAIVAIGLAAALHWPLIEAPAVMSLRPA
jgi:hypothetical protein